MNECRAYTIVHVYEVLFIFSPMGLYTGGLKYSRQRFVFLNENRSGSWDTNSDCFRSILAYFDNICACLSTFSHLVCIIYEKKLVKHDVSNQTQGSTKSLLIYGWAYTPGTHLCFEKGGLIHGWAYTLVGL